MNSSMICMLRMLNVLGLDRLLHIWSQCHPVTQKYLSWWRAARADATEEVDVKSPSCWFQESAFKATLVHWLLMPPVSTRQITFKQIPSLRNDSFVAAFLCENKAHAGEKAQLTKTFSFVSLLLIGAAESVLCFQLLTWRQQPTYSCCFYNQILQWITLKQEGNFIWSEPKKHE